MKNGLILAATLLAAPLLSTPAHADALKPFTATYRASYMGLSGTGTMTLTQTGSRYKVNLTVNALMGSAAYGSTFDANGNVWRLVSTTDTRKFMGKQSKRIASYDWGKSEARWSGDVKPDRQGPIRMQAGDVDPMTLDLALVRDVKAGKPLQYRMLENGKVKRMVFTIAGKESVTIEGKMVSATKVVRRDGDDELAVWVAEGYPVPVRLRQNSDGEVTDLRLKSVN